MAGKKMQKSEERLCFVEDIEKDRATYENYKTLVKGSKFICKSCGRVAAKDSNLCSPDKL